MFRVAKTFRFEAAHCLPDHDGKCRELHGHSYKVEVVFECDHLAASGPKKGMVVDFGDIKRELKPVVDALDHTVINASEWWKDSTRGGLPPTAEALAAAIAEWYCDRYPEWYCDRYKAPLLRRVRVWETEDSWAEFEVPR